jgi:hypothetical protein
VSPQHLLQHPSHPPTSQSSGESDNPLPPPKDVFVSDSPFDSDEDPSLVALEGHPDYPSQATNLSLQEDSAGDDDSNDSLSDDDYTNLLGISVSGVSALTSPWSLPPPSNHRLIIDDVRIHPVEESLLCLLIENSLPKRMYSLIMQWALHATIQEYEFSEVLSYQTVLSRMIKKYVHVSGGPPRSEVVIVPGYSPVHVYRFDFLKQVTHLLSNESLMCDSLWRYNACVDYDSGDKLYGEMNTGNFWKLGGDYVQNRVNALAVHDGLQHYFCPIILFIDATLVDRIDHLKVEPVLCSMEIFLAPRGVPHHHGSSLVSFRPIQNHRRS